MQELLSNAVHAVALLDHRSVEWERVRQSRYWLYQRFHYRYPGHIQELRQRLMVAPVARYGDQRLCAFHLHVSAPDAVTKMRRDRFGNSVYEVYIPRAEGEVSFEMRLVVERDLATVAWPQLSAAQAQLYRKPTPLTQADVHIRSAALDLAAAAPDGAALAMAINSWVYEAMSYGSGATTVETTAAEALAVGQGLCQDYAHIMLAMCRTAGLPARYVSGHMLGEGGSHAWVEVLLPEGEYYRALAFDPTNHRRITPSYITVATGRDYRDVAPTSGTYIAPYAGKLEAHKRAGITHCEYIEQP
ncbi:transglutaminase family protein [Candidatus Gracilibacteria bacterium]|nr:transglutaminase family protein [Candidatus Gracilibacteria bacterium]